MAKRKGTKGQRDKQRSTKHTHKTKDRVTRIPLRTEGELRKGTQFLKWLHISAFVYFSLIRRVGRYQRKKYKRTKHTYKSQRSSNANPPKNRGWTQGSGRVSCMQTEQLLERFEDTKGKFRSRSRRYNTMTWIEQMFHEPQNKKLKQNNNTNTNRNWDVGCLCKVYRK